MSMAVFTHWIDEFICSAGLKSDLGVPGRSKLVNKREGRGRGEQGWSSPGQGNQGNLINAALSNSGAVLSLVLMNHPSS